MAVYFIIENEGLTKQKIKIGFSEAPNDRIRALQTGNSRKLALMGWIETEQNAALEKALHAKYADKCVLNEWFDINHEDVLTELKMAGSNGYIALQNNANQFVGRDSDGVDEYLPPWEWADTDVQDFCPQCGCACGLQFNENYGTERCLKCGVTHLQHEPM